MSIDDLVNKKVSIRSRDYPHFELVNGYLSVNRNLDYNYMIVDDGKKFSFDLYVVKERINSTLFI